MKLLTTTNLYPGRDMPRHGIFVEERLRHLVRDESLQAEVIALRPGLKAEPWFESRHGIAVQYIPVPTLPVITNWIDPILWQHAVRPVVQSSLQDGKEQLILDSHFLYPDGVAAAIIGLHLDIPVVLTARGSDVNVKCRNPVMRRWIRWACARSAATITVSAALRDRLCEYGVDEGKVTVIRNGVDLDRFSPPPYHSEQSTGSAKTSLLSVGHLIAEKGHQLAIDALSVLDDAELTIVGQGPFEAALKRQAERSGVADRVSFDKIYSGLPGFTCKWDAEAGANQLRSVFEKIQMTQSVFDAAPYTRLKCLKNLLTTGQIDEDYYWTSQ